MRQEHQASAWLDVNTALRTKRYTLLAAAHHDKTEGLLSLCR